MSANRQKRRAPKTAFKPGQSGNPSGRPKSTLSKTLALALGKRAKDFEGSNEEAIVEKVVELAKAGDRAMIEFIWDRLEGKVAQPMELGGNDGTPIKFTLALGDAQRA